MDRQEAGTVSREPLEAEQKPIKITPPDTPVEPPEALMSRASQPEWLHQGESVLMPFAYPGWAIVYNAEGVACRMLWFSLSGSGE